mgnify:FL=1
MSRDPDSKWYISNSTWSEEFFPLWFQGLIYFLSPSSSTELFKLALLTPYLHTDDVYIGVLVKKLQQRFFMQVGTVPDLSVYAYHSIKPEELEDELLPFWLEGNITAFHVPHHQIFAKWSSLFYSSDEYHGIISSKTWFRR